MKKYALLLAVIMAVSLCGVLWTDDNDDHPVPSWVNDHIKSIDFFRSTDHFPRDPNPKKLRKTHDGRGQKSEGWHPKAKYRVTKWIRVNDSSYKLIIEAKDGSKVKDVNGRSNEGITLRKPIQFMVPDWVTVVHVDEKVNYKILDNGELKELELCKEGNSTFRIAYPGDNVLLVNGDGLTTWVRK